ncbi:MAG: endospore germination permease [Clostridia bacterium]|nr:endospore germination permease [Clostridia bacterium]
MTKKPYITSIQVAAISGGSALMFPYTFLPVLRVTPANQDAWLVVLLSLLYMILFNVPILLLINKFRGLNAVEIMETVMGKPAGKASAFLLFMFAMFCFFSCMQAMSIYLKLYIIAETPLWVIIMFLLIPLTYASMKGAGVVARLGVTVVPFVVLTIVAFFIMGIKDMEIANLMPIGADSSFLDLNYGAILTAARFSEIIVLAVFSYYLKDDVSINGTYFKSILIFGSTFLLMTLATLLLMGSGVAKLQNNPFLSYARQVGGGEILQRVQALNIFSWFGGSILKLTIYNYIASFILSKIVGSNKLKPKHYAIPLSLIAFILTFIPVMRKMSTLHYINSELIFPSIVFSVVVVLPVIILIVYLFRYKAVNKATTDLLNAKKQQEEQQNMEESNVQSVANQPQPQPQPPTAQNDP